ncbi:MAG: hypothetical protein RBT42_11985 [Aquabacterium sp.]|jgi:hypothetical protein|uniref:hypothetical protein n=1 Tax=Aquabacterium sp. TaxID=1872578 RepID=UPI002A36BA3E|nr:hypothetical protein [Aquabacterium sp.]MDX9844465.1 hypothetical protein [Aquabacterium sp.]
MIALRGKVMRRYFHLDGLVRFTVLRFFWILIASIHCAKAEGYLFVGVHRPPLDSPRTCPKFSLKLEAFDTESEARARKKEFLANRGYVDVHVDVLKPGKVGLVYEYISRAPALFGDCSFKKYSSISGSSEAAARENLIAHVNQYRIYFATDPEVVRVWPQEEHADEILKKYDGVEVLYMSLKSKSGRGGVLAKIRNTHPDKLARLTFRVNGKLLDSPVYIDPLGTATASLGHDVENFGAALQLLEGRDPNMERNNFIKSLKDIVYDMILIKHGKMEVEDKKSVAIGVRG